MSVSPSLDQKMDELLGPKTTEGHGCPIFLEMPAATARVVIEGLRWALYGGQQPPDGRRSLLIVLDALTAGLAQ